VEATEKEVRSDRELDKSRKKGVKLCLESDSVKQLWKGCSFVK